MDLDEFLSTDFTLEKTRDWLKAVDLYGFYGYFSTMANIYVSGL